MTQHIKTVTNRGNVQIVAVFNNIIIWRNKHETSIQGINKFVSFYLEIIQNSCYVVSVC